MLRFLKRVYIIICYKCQFGAFIFRVYSDIKNKSAVNSLLKWGLPHMRSIVASFQDGNISGISFKVSKSSSCSFITFSIFVNKEEITKT